MDVATVIFASHLQTRNRDVRLKRGHFSILVPIISKKSCIETMWNKIPKSFGILPSNGDDHEKMQLIILIMVHTCDKNGLLYT